jgi:hypothetical protein
MAGRLDFFSLLFFLGDLRGLLFELFVACMNRWLRRQRLAGFANNADELPGERFDAR